MAHKQMAHKKAFLSVATLIGAGLMLAACGSAAAPATSRIVPAASSTSASPAARASTSAPAATSSAPASLAQASSVGTPNLKGMNLKIGLGAGSPHVADTEVYVMVQMLKKWGANAKLVRGAGDAPTMATVSGQLDVAVQGMSEMLNAGLNIFGPNQPRVDYVMVSRKLTSVDQLPGHVFGLGGSKNGPDAVLLHAEEALHNIPQNKVKELQIASVSDSVSAMLGGRLDASFIHGDGLAKIQPQGFHVLSVASKDVPWYADSYMAAKPAWLKAHANEALAIDEAWLAAAKIFNTNTKQWVAYAQQYTQHANSDAAVTAAHTLFKSLNLWPDAASSYSESSLQKNWNAANQQKDIQKRGKRPISQWGDITAWQAATKAMGVS